jgi:hypothetical protein
MLCALLLSLLAASAAVAGEAVSEPSPAGKETSEPYATGDEAFEPSPAGDEVSETQVSSDYSGILTLFVENDLFLGRDDNFTSAVGISWVSNRSDRYRRKHIVNRMTRTFSFLPTVGSRRCRNFVGFTLGHEMYTPTDIEIRPAPADQQPYAGILFLDSAFYGMTDRSLHDLTLRLGLVGPASFAGETQRAIHRWIGSPIPQGWDDQLSNEPLLNVNYQWYRRLVRQTTPGKPHYDVTSRLGGALGNYFTGGIAGVVVRVGYRLPDNYGAASLRTGGASRFVGLDPPPRRKWKGYAFLGLSGFAVGRFLPADGNTVRDSPSVERDDFQANLASGFIIGYDRWLFSWTLNNLAGLSDLQLSPSEDFGTVTVSYFFRGKSN